MTGLHPKYRATAAEHVAMLRFVFRRLLQRFALTQLFFAIFFRPEPPFIRRPAPFFQSACVLGWVRRESTIGQEGEVRFCVSVFIC